MANHSQGKFWSPSLLKTRGWTNELIEKLLPKPRYRRMNGRSTPIWHRDDVRAAEETDLFKKIAAKLLVPRTSKLVESTYGQVETKKLE